MSVAPNLVPTQDIYTGYRCSCCGLYVRAYRRKLNSNMARGLIACVRHTAPGEWKFMMPLLKPFNGWADFGKLRFWGLVEHAAPDPDADHPRSGLWMATLEGRQFAHGLIHVRRYVTIFNNQRVADEDPEDATRFTTIQRALGDRFSYTELMRTA